MPRRCDNTPHARASRERYTTSPVLVLILLTASLQWDATTTLTVAGGNLTGGYTGTFEVLTPELALEHPASGAFLDLALPLARLTLGAYDFMGPGDLSVTGGVRLGAFRLGLSTMWPTGDEHRGLGTAHVMLAPRVDVAKSIDRLQLSATALVRGALAWGSHGAHNHQSLIAPHDVLDARFTARLATRPLDWLELAGLAVPIVTLVPHPLYSPGSRLSLGAEVLARFGIFHLSAQALLPVTANRTSSWQFGFALGAGAGGVEDVTCH